MDVYGQVNVILEAAQYVGKDTAMQAYTFTARQGLELLKYDPVADTWQLTDGEIYSTARIKNEMRKAP